MFWSFNETIGPTFTRPIASLAFPDLAVTLTSYFRRCRAIVEGLGLACNIMRADDSASTAIKDIDVDHGGFDVFVRGVLGWCECRSRFGILGRLARFSLMGYSGDVSMRSKRQELDRESV